MKARSPNKIKKRKKTGLPPGSIVFTGDQKVDHSIVHFLQFDQQNLMEEKITQHSQISNLAETEGKVDWYDIRGIHDTTLLELFGKTFSIHPLALEDIADIHQRPKYEEYEEGNFIILQALTFQKDIRKVTSEQVAIYFRNGLLISFQETESDLFEGIRHRLKNHHGRIRQKESDYLCYALMDTVVDNYYVLLDEIGDVMEEIEDKLISNPDHSIKENVHHLKKELLFVKKSIAPLREAMNRFSKSDNPYISDSSSMYTRDLYDHIIQIMDSVETHRDVLHGLQDLYLSEISFKMNQVMQILTIITTIFVPLSFLAGLYGMNFVNMPELQSRNGYYILLAVMFLIFISLLIFFKRKKWF
jgi:magnesium transporter